jgi:hypothetical protein
MGVAMSDEFRAYVAAEKNLDAARAAISELADTLSGVATILRNDPTRFARPNPNFAEVSSSGRLMVDEPDPIDLNSIPEQMRGSLANLAQLLVKAQRDFTAAKAALPADLASRLAPRRV